MTRRLVAVLSLVLGLAAALAVLPAAPSSALAVLTVDPRDDPADPQLLSTSSGRITEVDVITDSNATNVQVTFSGAGLTIDTPVVDLGDVNGSERASVEVTATSGGFHTLSIQVTSTSSSPVSTSLPYMWAPGGAPLPATGDLTGRNYAGTDLYTFTGTSYEDRQMLTFLDGETAFIGFPAKGRPTCGSASDTKRTGCVSYRFDSSTGLVQIGGAIGRVLGKNVYVNGIGRADDSEGELFNARTFSRRVGFPSPGKKYGGAWRWSYDNYPNGELVDARLVLRKNGTFELTWRYGGQKLKSRKGTYALTAPGRLRLKGAFGTELHTLAIRANSSGKADPGKGLWLTFGSGKNVDGVPLKPVT